jgi:hypothetical protein
LILPISPDVAHAIESLKALHSGDVGVVEAISCGRAAVPALRDVLFEGDLRSIYQPRCRAVEALAALGAYDVLSGFLTASHEVEDPVERMGEEAVINAAALALSKVREDWAYQLLFEFAGRHPLPGVIAALATFERTATIPILIDALGEDDARLTAEAALRRLGSAAQIPLVRAAILSRPSAEGENCSSLRRRRAALGLLIAVGICAQHWPALRHLMDDEDKRISVLACRLCLSSGPVSERSKAVGRLAGLLPNADWRSALEIEEVLELHLDGTAEFVAASITSTLRKLPQNPPQTPAIRALLGLRERAEAVLKRARA